MTIINALLLGLLQGLTQFLPVSSSGHFALISGLFSTGSISADYPYIQAFMHIGSFAALLIMFWGEIGAMLSSLAGLGRSGVRQDRCPARLFIMLMAATVPMALALPIGFGLQALAENGIFVGIMFGAMGCVLFVSEKFFPGKKNEGSMSVFDALIIGLCQLTGVIPGISRMGVTYTAGVAAGLDRSFAVKFAYLTCIPASAAVIIAMLVSNPAALVYGDVPVYIVSLIGAMLSGIAMLAIMKKLLAKVKFGFLGLYCLIVGAISIILTLIF